LFGVVIQRVYYQIQPCPEQLLLSEFFAWILFGGGCGERGTMEEVGDRERGRDKITIEIP
jgi:hypothetical protein